MKKMIGVAAALLLIGAATGFAQGKDVGRVTGTVHVATSGGQAHDSTAPSQAVVGASVRVLETLHAAVTDDKGSFTLDSMPAGQYVVEARLIGFRPTRGVIRVEPGRDVNLELHMVPAPITLDAMVVEALVEQGQRTYDLSSLGKVAPVGTANVTTVTAEAIRDVHAKEPWEMVRSATGLEVHEQGQGPVFASNAVIRGFTSDHSSDVALVVDGIPLNEPMNGHGEGYADWNVIFPAAIADVQVIKGPISPLFGNFAAGGAVNVSTVASTTRTRFTAEGGSYGYGGGTLTTGFEHGPWGGFLGTHGVRSSGWRDNSGYDALQLIGRLNRRVSPTVLLDAGVQYYTSGWDSPGYLSLHDFFQAPLTNAADVTDGGNTHRLMERVTAAINRPSFSWQTTTWAYQKFWHLFLTIPELGGSGEGLGGQTEEIDDRSAFGGRSLARWTTGTTEISFGAEGSRNQATYSIWTTTARTRDSTAGLFDARLITGAAIAGVSRTFGRTLRLESALRADALAPTSTDLKTSIALPVTNRTILSPKFGAVWYARGDIQFYASAARGFRSVPSTIRDPLLPPQTEWSYEGGSRISFKRLDASAAFFYLQTRNERLLNPITLQTESTGRSQRSGLETELKLRVARALEIDTHWTINLMGRFSLSDTGTAASPAAVALRIAGGLGSSSSAALMHDVGSGKYVPAVADYSGHVGLVVKPGDRFSISAWTTVVGPYVPIGEPGQWTDPYALASLQASARLSGRIELTAGMDNLLNTKAPEIRASGAVNPVEARSVHLGFSAGT